MPLGQLFSTFQLGTWNPATDTWTFLYDLNQPTTGPVFIMAKYPQWAPGEKYDSRSQTIRATGERIVETNLKNGHWKVKLTMRGSTTDAIASIVRSITQALEQPQLCIRYAAPNATKYLYFDVRKTTHNLHQAMAQQLIAGVQSALIDFECFPLARGDRIWLQNLVANAGAEAPSGPLVQVFSDSFGTINDYTTVVGSAPTSSAGVMTVPSGTTVTFGSPAWGALQWSVRFQWQTSGNPYFALHYTNANNLLYVSLGSTSFSLLHHIAGVDHSIGGGSFGALTNGTFYWMTITQFPTPTGNKPYVTATLSNDSSGAIGTTIQSAAGLTFDAVTALVGTPALVANAGISLKLGGFTPSSLAYTFGPGGWNWSSSGTGTGSGAWDGTRPEIGMSGTAVAGNQTTPNGPVTSAGALRIDAAPAGTLSAAWNTWFGGAAPTSLLAAAEAIPTAQNHVLGVSCQLKSTGVGAGCSQVLNVVEFNASGTVLVTGTVATKTGAQSTWTTLSGSYTVANAATAYVAIQLGVSDATAGSANGQMWFDNVQCWDQTTTGETSMPYCELRFPQSPCQLLLSGLLGDQPAPLLCEFGTYETSFNTGQSLSFGIGRKATTGLNVQLVVPPSVGNATAIPSLSASAYGGVTIAQNGVMATFITPSLGIGVTMPDTQGIYHVICLMQTAESAGNLPFVVVQYTTGQIGPVHLSSVLGPSLSPFSASSTFQPLDLGQVALPSYPLMAASAQNQFLWYVQVGIDDILGTSAETSGWHFLLPYDAEKLLGQILNPAGYQNLTNQFLWFYNEALTLSQNTLFPQSWQTQAIGGGAANTSLATIGQVGGGPGSSASSFITINPTGSSFLREDPTQTTPNSGGLGVNQFGAFITDNTGTVLPFFCDVLYSPYYEYQR